MFFFLLNLSILDVFKLKTTAYNQLKQGYMSKIQVLLFSQDSSVDTFIFYAIHIFKIYDCEL